MHLVFLKFGFAASMATLMLSHSSAVFAGGLQVVPTVIQMPVSSTAAGIWLSNTNTVPITAQVRVFKWSQENGEDLLAPTTQLTISPPLAEIPPGGKQLIRIIRTGAAPATGAEATYRLIVDELPAEVPEAVQPKDPLSSRRTFGMNFLMRYSVPVFIGDATDDSLKEIGKQLDWSAQKDAATGQWSLRVTNRSLVRAQLADLSAISGDGQTQPILAGMLGYVLPGTARQWKLPALPAASTIKGYQAQINADTQKINVQGLP